jgi:peptide/nickel transport system substrate-binding protein
LTYDPEYSPTAAAGLAQLKGIKFLSNDTVSSYVDAWHFDPKEIADFATLWAVEPWEITAAQERLVTSGKVSFSSSGAVQKGVDWLSLVNPTHAGYIQAELQKMKDENFIPAPLQGKVTIAEADKRYDASIKWITDHKHAVISNGPFYLDTFNAEGQTATLKAFRDSTYPFDQNYWPSKFGIPKIASVERIDVTGPISAGNSTTMNVSVDVAGKPSNDAQVKYFLIGDKGVVSQGNATTTSNQGTFTIALSSNQTQHLDAGAYTMKVIAIGNEAYKPAFAMTPVLVVNVPEFGSQLGLVVAVAAISAVVLIMRVKSSKEKSDLANGE